MNMIALFYHDSHVPTFAKTGTRFALCKFFHVDWSNGFYFCITCGHKMSVSLNKDNCHKMKKQKLHPECVAEGMEQVLVVLHFIPVQLPAGGWADHQRKAVQHTLTHSVCAQNSERHTHTHTHANNGKNNEILFISETSSSRKL